MEEKSLNEYFRILTGAVNGPEAIIEDSKENSEEAFKHILWHIPGGVKYLLNSDLKEAIKEVINQSAKELDIDANEVLESLNKEYLIDIIEDDEGSKIEIEEKPEEPSTENKWDGKSYKEPEQDENGIYLISCPEELAWLAKTITKDNTKNNFYELTEDIDLNNQNWTPIGQTTGVMGGNDERIAFKGTFDGKNHTISNFSTDVKDELAKSGLFAALEGTVKNLKIINALVNSTHYAGVIAAYNTDTPCIIDNCAVEDSTVITTPENSTGSWDNGDKAGAIIGYVRGHSSVIRNCKVKNVTIKAYRDLGAIAGYVSDLTNFVITFKNNIIEDVKLIQDLTNEYKDFSKIENHYGNVYGWNDGKGTIIDENNIGEAEYGLIGGELPEAE